MASFSFQLSYADISFFNFMNSWIAKDKINGYPDELKDFPLLQGLYERVRDIPAVKTRLKTRPDTVLWKSWINRLLSNSALIKSVECITCYAENKGEHPWHLHLIKPVNCAAYKLCSQAGNTVISRSGDRGFQPHPFCCFLREEHNSTLSLFTQVYEWVRATYCWGGGGGGGG